MPHHNQQPTTVAVLGTNSLLDRILVRLLRDEGYDAKLLKAHPGGHIDELLDGMDVLLLSPYLDTDVRGAFLNAMRSTPEAARRVPVISLPLPLQAALLDELSVNVPWQSLFGRLVQEIEVALGRSEAGAEAPPMDAGEPPKDFFPRGGEAA